MQMKIADGYDALGELKITYADFMAQFEDMFGHLTDNGKGKTIQAKSAFEVGCGCGPNLLLMQERGLSVGGMDFSIGILDLFDVEKEEEFLAYRRKHIENYDEKYKGLGKLFVSRDFFVRFAKQEELDITFTQTNLAGYWNNEFIFNVFLYKK